MWWQSPIQIDAAAVVQPIIGLGITKAMWLFRRGNESHQVIVILRLKLKLTANFHTSLLHNVISNMISIAPMHGGKASPQLSFVGSFPTCELRFDHKPMVLTSAAYVSLHPPCWFATYYGSALPSPFLCRPCGQLPPPHLRNPPKWLSLHSLVCFELQPTPIRRDFAYSLPVPEKRERASRKRELLL